MGIHYALEFIFDGVISSTYNLKIMNMSSSGTSNSSGGMNISMFTDSIYRDPIQKLYGVAFDKPLEFKLSFGTGEPIDVSTRSIISRWLFGKTTYKKLELVQDDMRDIYFNCMLVNPKIISIGNQPYLYECDVICDAPWAWESDKELIKTFDDGMGSFVFKNTSDYMGFLKPELEFTVKDAGNAAILNKVNRNVAMKFKELASGEVITIDNRLEIIKSSTDINRLKNFNKEFLYFVPDDNMITVENISKIKINYKFARGVGA